MITTLVVLILIVVVAVIVVGVFVVVVLVVVLDFVIVIVILIIGIIMVCWQGTTRVRPWALAYSELGASQPGIQASCPLGLLPAAAFLSLRRMVPRLLVLLRLRQVPSRLMLMLGKRRRSALRCIARSKP